MIYLSLLLYAVSFFFFSSRRRHTRCSRDWSSDVCSSDLGPRRGGGGPTGLAGSAWRVQSVSRLYSPDWVSPRLAPAAGPRGDRDPSPGAGRKPGELFARPCTAPRSRCARRCRRIPWSGSDRDRLDRQHHHGSGLALRRIEAKGGTGHPDHPSRPLLHRDSASPARRADGRIGPGAHKWSAAPGGGGRGGGERGACPAATAMIPTFNRRAGQIWVKAIPPEDIPPAALMTPGGFHSFEHRWALGEAFRFHQRIGKPRIAERIHLLNRQLKEGLAKMSHIKLHTPLADNLSAGIVCFEVDGTTPEEVVTRLRERRIIASVTPYATRYARLAPSLLTSPEEIDTALREVRALA